MKKKKIKLFQNDDTKREKILENFKWYSIFKIYVKMKQKQQVTYFIYYYCFYRKRGNRKVKTLQVIVKSQLLLYNVP